MTVRKLFFGTTAAAAAVVVLAFCLMTKWGDEAQEARIKAEDIQDSVFRAFCQVRPDRCRNDYPIDGEEAELYAGGTYPKQMLERRVLRYTVSTLKKREAAAEFVGAAVFGAWVLALPAFIAGGLSGRARTQGQRAGLVLFGLSPACLVFHRLRVGHTAGLLDSPEFIAFLAVVGIGALLFSGLPQRLLAWVSGGEKD